jgi:hypothetical protein
MDISIICFYAVQIVNCTVYVSVQQSGSCDVYAQIPMEGYTSWAAMFSQQRSLASAMRYTPIGSLEDREGLFTMATIPPSTLQWYEIVQTAQRGQGAPGSVLIVDTLAELEEQDFSTFVVGTYSWRKIVDQRQMQMDFWSRAFQGNPAPLSISVSSYRGGYLLPYTEQYLHAGYTVNYQNGANANTTTSADFVLRHFIHLEAKSPVKLMPVDIARATPEDWDRAQNRMKNLNSLTSNAFEWGQIWANVPAITGAIAGGILGGPPGALAGFGAGKLFQNEAKALFPEEKEVHKRAPAKRGRHPKK